MKLDGNLATSLPELPKPSKAFKNLGKTIIFRDEILEKPMCFDGYRIFSVYFAFFSEVCRESMIRAAPRQRKPQRPPHRHKLNHPLRQPPSRGHHVADGCC